MSFNQSITARRQNLIAHPPIITEDEARRIAGVRREQNKKRFYDKGFGRSRASKYLLSGGLFKCARCGSNMAGLRTASGSYYVCGSTPYRKGMGCGPGVYVRKDEIENDVITGLTNMLDVCADTRGFTRQVNEELKRLWRESSGYEPNATKRVAELDAKIANIHKSIEDGLADTAWANERLKILAAERRQLFTKTATVGEAPQTDVDTAIAYRRRIGKILAGDDYALTKNLLRKIVEEIKLAPESREVLITYRTPEPVMDFMVAGVGFEPTTFGL